MMKRSGFTFTEKMSVMANSLVSLNVNSDDTYDFVLCGINLELFSEEVLGGKSIGVLLMFFSYLLSIDAHILAYNVLF